MNESGMTQQWKDFIRIIKAEVKPATGCTEPVALALATATATTYLSGPPQRIEAWVSPNLMKNGMGVTVPGSGMKGLPVAAVLGALCGDAQAGLKVLHTVTPEQVFIAKEWICNGQVSVNLQPDCTEILYVRARVFHENEHATVTISGCHTGITCIESGNDVVFQKLPAPQDNGGTSLRSFFSSVTLEQIVKFSESVPLKEITFINDAATINDVLSQEGLNNQWGLHLGMSLMRQRERQLIGDDLMSSILIRTSAASDARMGGASLPAMSNSGSGNQGIAATMPVVVVAEHLNAGSEQLARALILSHLTAIYIHSKLPTLSALCAASTASMGAAAGMAWLIDGRLNVILMTINSMISDVSGIICDGASNSCAMKVSTGATSAWKAVLMALDNTAASGSDGIVCTNVERSLDNLGALACRSMRHTDIQIIEMMLDK
ncbi:L-serine ammonia-lyase, iron-sulfur-dependent, subunit alpha [Enterobacteriaceae bacterium H11S18]|uniref:L-cysteine desulfidase family protein n=1 Tax=Dryocola clanedunensis TaxID=2925396 RepID=UPI0022F090F9|nr:L-serine ammonia-lyase, iron-sulfur-dependent, subunit alpha [Dryocola clanedunensis]MCT4708870.1 L-serine ammonia-lyase, iron-sulfur-dependent, subunit alpha [Dryocola clanedunensis]